MSSTTMTVAQILSISGGMATLSFFDVPELRSQPASHSLPSIRWLFSRGSHIFPSAAFLSSAGFAYLAYTALPLVGRHRAAITQLLKLSSNSHKVNGYLAAAALTLSIGPFTTFAMIPTNFTLIEMNEKKGGARSEKAASENPKRQAGGRSALDSVDGKGDPGQFSDLSGPQARTEGETTGADDKKVRELLDRFAGLNATRAVLMAAGGMIGLWAALL